MKSTKFFVVLMVFFLAAALLAGCSGSNDNESNNSSGEPATNEPATNDSASTDTPSDQSEESERPAWQTEKFTLKYASWEDPKVEAPMLKAFMEKYPNITVVKDETINWPWTDALTNAASAGNLPDVFTLENVAVGVQNDWLLDITELWNNDAEAAAVYPNIAAMPVYNGKRLAAPTFQFIMGVYLNKTLFEKNNVPLPAYNWTITEMIDLAKKLSDPQNYYYGIGGAWGSLMFEEHFPMNNDASLAYNTYDGEKFHFTNQQWIDGYNLKLELRRLKVEEHMTEEEKEKALGDKGAWPTQKGHVAMAIDGSWNLGWLPNDMKTSGAGELDFYPYPGGSAGQRMPVILDYIGMSSTTKHPEAAYELMKFMSWGKDGWLKRIDITKEAGFAFDRFPVSDQPEIWDKLTPEITLPGLKASLDLLPNAVPDFNKTLPGWNEFNNWLNNEQKIPEKIEKGELKVADMAKQMEDKANEFVSQGKASLGQ